MQTRKQIIDRNFEILDKFFMDVQAIFYSTLPKHVKRKKLYSAKYWAEYFMQIQGNLINEHLQEKPKKP